MVPQPVYAVLMLFPVSEASEKHRKEQEEEVAALEEKEGKSQDKDGVYFIKQVIGNACGTIGLTHCVCNLTKQLELDDDKFFAKFHAATKDMNGLARAKALEDNEDIEVEHQATAAQGAENVSDAVNDNLHFNTFVRVGDNLYELDGRKERPINHGPCKADEVLSKAVAVGTACRVCVDASHAFVFVRRLRTCVHTCEV